jgi:hypothetical protein
VTWRWLIQEGDGPIGFLPKSDERPPGALRCDERVAAGGGPGTWVSLCRFPEGTTLAFDDPMVTGALRARLAAPRWPVAVSTLLVDWSRIAGAITVGESRHDVAGDPFARVFPRRILRVESGTLGRNPRPTGPGVTRYGSGNPWPWDRYAGQVT